MIINPIVVEAILSAASYFKYVDEADFFLTTVRDIAQPNSSIKLTSARQHLALLTLKRTQVSYLLRQSKTAFPGNTAALQSTLDDLDEVIAELQDYIAYTAGSALSLRLLAPINKKIFSTLTKTLPSALKPLAKPIVRVLNQQSKQVMKAQDARDLYVGGSNIAGVAFDKARTLSHIPDGYKGNFSLTQLLLQKCNASVILSIQSSVAADNDKVSKVSDALTMHYQIKYDNHHPII